MNLSLTVSPPAAADLLGPDDVVLYRPGTIAAPPLFEPGRDYEPAGPAVIVAIYPEKGPDLNMRHAALWARAYRVVAAVAEARAKAAEAQALRAEVLAVTRELFPALADDGWIVADWHRSNGWQATHEALDITIEDHPDGLRRCVWGSLASERVAWRGSWTEVWQRVIWTLKTYLGNKRTQAGASARIVARRERAQALLAAMGGES